MNELRRRWFLAVLVGFAVLPVVFTLPDVLPAIILEVFPAKLAATLVQAVGFISALHRNVIANGAAVAAGLLTALTYKGRGWWPIGLAAFSLVLIFLLEWIFANFAPGTRSTLEKLLQTVKWIGELALSWATVSWFISQVVVLAMMLTYFLAGRRLNLR